MIRNSKIENQYSDVNHTVIHVKEVLDSVEISDKAKDNSKDINEIKSDTKDKHVINQSYQDLFKNINIILRIIGLYHKKSDRLILKLYTILILILCWTHCFKTLVIFDIFIGKQDDFSAIFILKLGAFGWALISSISGTIIFFNQELSSREKSLIEQYNILLSDQNHKTYCIIKRKVFIVIIISIIIGSMNVTGLLISLFGPSSFFMAFSFLVSPFHRKKSDEISLAYKIFSGIAGCYISFLWTVTLGYFCSHCVLIVMMLRSYNKKFKEFIFDNILAPYNSNKIDKPMKLQFEEINNMNSNERIVKSEFEFEKFRLLHLRFCYTIKLLDKCYTQYLAFSLFIQVLTAFCMLYLMADWNDSGLGGIMGIMVPFWCSVILFYIFTSVIFASQINHKVKNNI